MIVMNKERDLKVVLHFKKFSFPCLSWFYLLNKTKTQRAKLELIRCCDNRDKKQ